MKEETRKMNIAVACVILVLASVSLVSAQESPQHISTVQLGTCHDITVSVFASSLPPGCYDVKIDVPGHVRVDGEWRSTFFYVPQALCAPGSAQFSLHLETDDSVNGAVKLRSGSRVRQEPLVVVQYCEQADDVVAWGALASILVLLAAVAYVRR